MPYVSHGARGGLHRHNKGSLVAQWASLGMAGLGLILIAVVLAFALG
jgi:hypothetical protein